MLKFNSITNCNVTNKNVIVRVDINVPIIDGKVSDDTRIRAVVPTLRYLVQQKAKIIIISHLGRPKGKFEPTMSMKLTLDKLKELLPEFRINFVDDCIGHKVEKAVNETGYGEIILLENIRFYSQEENNEPEFAKKLASLGDIYVNDAFSCSHRAHASIVGIAKILKSYAGLQMEKELKNLSKLLDKKSAPMIAVIGGAKISTKIDLLKNLSAKCQAIAIVGGMANTFLYALGNNIGSSLCEKDLKDKALEIISQAKANNCKIILPVDVVVAKEFKEGALARTVKINQVLQDDIILDIGNISVSKISEEIRNYKTLLWNGPLGAFEIKPFNVGTENFIKSVIDQTANNSLTSISGGGDSIFAINSVEAFDKFSYISTAGGAFLEWIEGKNLPGVTRLLSTTNADCC